ncbi:MAG TPA: cupin domain-containing protein [Armatimonadetes bacterium]|nr:cupin domain-containing protein [Armatimonadota bacterium]
MSRGWAKVKRFRIGRLDKEARRFLEGPIEAGGILFKKPGQVSHEGERHTHDRPEVFIALSGRAKLLVDGVEHPFEAGDIVVIEPGEEHHIVADEEDPIVNIWLHIRAEGIEGEC